MKQGDFIGLLDRDGFEIAIGDVVEYHPSHYENQTKISTVTFERGTCHPIPMISDPNRKIVAKFIKNCPTMEP